VFDGKKVDGDDPAMVRTGDAEHEFKVEIGFQELEVVAYSGDLKIVGYAHFGHGGRASSRRASDHLRHIADERLTLSRARIYRHATGELLESAPFVVVNLARVDAVYARDAQGDIDDEQAGDGGVQASAGAPDPAGPVGG
jgi:hypothetical protein